MPSSSVPKHEQSETLVGLNPVKTEYASGVNGQPFSPMTSLSTLPLSNDLASHPKEEGQEHTHVFPTPAGTHGYPHHRPHANDSFHLQDPAMYLGRTSPPPSKRHPPPPSLAIPGQLAYSPGARNPTPLSSSFSSSDIGTPTSSIHLDTNAASSSQVPPPASAPNPKAGQGVLKLPSTKRSARRKPAIACLFCRERKIACGAPPVGSADPTCNVHGAHASVNTPQCRDVGSISVVIMGAATTRNPRTQITSLIHSRLRSSFPCFFLSFLPFFPVIFFPCMHTHTFTHTQQTIQALMCLLGQCILITLLLSLVGCI
ncbi:hypothetical protein EDB89DRAFT_1481701 [Lactarius sanguifluus]|nr:hypothetical protein EDB89DRAFT_1481701 [Lactarius sanguifluus]